MRKVYLVATGIFLLTCLVLLPGTAESLPPSAGKPGEKVDVVPKLGETIPLDSVFTAETGEKVTLRELIDRPALISFVYLSCRHACPRLLTGLAEVLGKTKLIPGKDFTVITISFDERDTPEVARDKKEDYLHAIGKPFPPDQWRFLTGTKESILKVTRAAGFFFRREGEGFVHPVVLVVVSKDGKIVRYLNGTSFLPFDLEMAVTEATEGRVGSITRRAVLFCFSYDPKGKRYVFNILRVVGIVTVLVALSLVVFLVATGKKQGRKGKNE